MSALLESLPHPLVCGVEAIKSALDLMPMGGWDGLDPEAIAQLSGELLRIEARVKAQQVAAARALDASGFAKASGASSTGAMLASAFGGDRAAADGMVKMGKVLGSASRTEQALADGEIGAAQAGIIAAAVADLPPDTTHAQKQACEDTLIGDAGRFTLKDLRSRSMRITDQFKPAPEVDQIENQTVEQREKAAWGRAEFTMVNDGDGMARGVFRIPEAQADMLMTAVRAISAPKRDHLHDDTPAAESYYDRDLDYRHRLGMGLAELCGHLPADKLPGRGGLGATLMVRLDYDTLLDGVKAATLSSGTRISAGQVRLMACNLGIIPQVFAGKSLPVDHGRMRRTFDKTQKQDMDARDGGCTFPGCDKPPEECEGHHWGKPWALGATTNLEDGVLICPFHHRGVHADNWAIRMHPVDGHVEYRKPGTGIWQRNTRWRP